MKRSVVAVGSAATLVASLTWGILGDAAPPESPYVKVEIRGQLLPGTEGAGSRPGTPVIKAEGMTFALEFKDQMPPPGKVRNLYNQTVVIRGTLRKQGRDCLVCIVEGDMEADTQDGTQADREVQYLVGYHEGQQSIVESLCQKLGLKVVDRYQPGKYLIIEPTEKTDAKFIDKLKESRAVRYVEKNMKYRIPEEKDTGPS